MLVIILAILAFLTQKLSFTQDSFDSAYRFAPISIDKPQLKYVGRFEISDPAGPRFSWSGTQIIGRFQGDSLSVRLKHERMSSINPIYYTYIVDGQPRQGFVAKAEETSYLLADHLGTGTHDFMLERETEGNQGYSQLLGLSFGNGGKLLAPYAPSTKRMEVIGDSISAGFGDNGTPGCNFSTATESAYLTYENIAARTLGMDLTTIAYSGKGIHNNWNTTFNDPKNPTMLHDFLYALTPTNYVSGSSDEGKYLWDFHLPPPDIVVINLGTNDFRNPALTTNDFASSFLQMVALVRAKYPQASIFAAVGSILDEPQLDMLRTSVQEAVKVQTANGDHKISYVEMTRNGTKWDGCGSHPDKNQHADMADMLVRAIRAQL